MNSYNHIEANKRKTTILLSLFFAIIFGIGWFFAYVLGYGEGIFIVAAVYAIITALIGYFHGDTVALWSAGANKIQSADNPYVYRLVENLCISQGMPVPQVYIIPSPALNAFATGRDPKHASIAITEGLIGALENEELEGVIAHELAHIQNYDIRVMTLVVVLVGTLSILADMLFRNHLFSRDSDRKGHPALLIIGIVLIVLSPIIGELIKLAISRKREFLADASGALMTRYPEGLARALEKISASTVPFDKANSGTAHLFISNPMKGKSFANFFSTHPPAEERIKRLRSM